VDDVSMQAGVNWLRIPVCKRLYQLIGATREYSLQLTRDIKVTTPNVRSARRYRCALSYIPRTSAFACAELIIKLSSLESRTKCFTSHHIWTSQIWPLVLIIPGLPCLFSREGQLLPVGFVERGRLRYILALLNH
jgi:hypothetical protein